MFLAAWFCFCGCASHYHFVDNGSVRFVLLQVEAREVYFASSLDGFVLHRAEPLAFGGWTARAPGGSEFRYFFIVDGSVYLPACAYRETDDFGSQNCIYSPGM
jgi:hypothetical protein